MELNSMYFGTIEKVMSPADSFNVSKYQYEYIVTVTCDLYSQMPVRCIALDPFGSFNAFQDSVFAVGHRVFVMFPKGDRTLGVILGGSRFYGPKTDPSLGLHLKKRFNEVVETYSKEGAWSIVSDDGPNLHVKKTQIVLDDSTGEKIVLDKAAKKITIDCQDWEVTVKGKATINVTGAATVSAASADVNISGKANVKAGSANIEASGEVAVKAGGDVKVDGSTVKLNGGSGEVLTTTTQPRCYVTGAPFIGAPTVKAG